eukprot:GDKK01013830.1.p1 GENE.GDKK01013830.1~~GDKK01013830.1.p1  ORF type:complete len:155 (+),score=44.90 GDKK01013830.1:484-948(+)
MPVSKRFFILTPSAIPPPSSTNQNPENSSSFNSNQSHQPVAPISPSIKTSPLIPNLSPKNVLLPSPPSRFATSPSGTMLLNPSSMFVRTSQSGTTPPPPRHLSPMTTLLANPLTSNSSSGQTQNTAKRNLKLSDAMQTPSQTTDPLAKKSFGTE